MSKIFFWAWHFLMYMLNIQSISILFCAKYRKASVEALVQADFAVYALSKHKQNPCSKANRKKNALVYKAVILSKNIFWHQTSSCKCSMCLYCVGKVSNSFSKSCGTSSFSCMCTIYMYMHVIQNGNIWLDILQKSNFCLDDTSSCTCSIHMYLYLVSESSSKSSGTIWFPLVCFVVVVLVFYTVCQDLSIRKLRIITVFNET